MRTRTRFLNMNPDKRYLRIEDELDKIIRTRINDRLTGAPKKTLPDSVINALEKIIREIIDYHNRGVTVTHVPFLFNAVLMVKEKGSLYIGRENTDHDTFEIYTTCKSRLNVIVTAALNAAKDELLIDLFNRKRNLFDDLHQKAAEALHLAAIAQSIIRETLTSDTQMPRNETESIAQLKKISGIRTQIREIESRYIELKQEPFIEESIRSLRNTLTLAWKELDGLTRQSSADICNQAHHIFQDFKATKAESANSESLIRQKEALVRYFNLFDSIGDENRKSQIEKYILSIDTTLADLNKTIEKQKQFETEMNEKSSQAAETAYNGFLQIKEMYSESKITTPEERKQALKSLHKYAAVLKSHGRRVKAGDIERFINSTGIADQAPNRRCASLNFYKRAFFILLPITLCLAVLVIYQLFK